MTNSKALAATERAGLTLFENPEITAMAAICDILQELPDEAARLRVMRWAFGRFSPEFKRPLPAEARPVAAAKEVVAPVAVPVTSMTAEIAAVAPEMATPAAGEDADFGTQISELRDFFAADDDRHPEYADAF